MVMVGTMVFAPIGGIWLMYLADFNMSVAAGVGFIALAGLAAETGRGDDGLPRRGLRALQREGRMKASLADLEGSRSSRARSTACDPS